MVQLTAAKQLVIPFIIPINVLEAFILVNVLDCEQDKEKININRKIIFTFKFHLKKCDKVRKCTTTEPVRLLHIKCLKFMCCKVFFFINTQGTGDC